jgi:CheY-like chemotaxis protein
MERLLIVDDEEFMRLITLETLRQAGYQAESAIDGEEAWSILNQRPADFSLILLDKQMPRLDGIGLLKRIKSDERIKDLPVIMLTGSTDQKDIAEGLAAGAHYYLTKPSTEKILKSVISNAMSDWRRKRELLSLVGHHTGAMRILRRAQFCFKTLREAESLALWLADASMAPSRTVTAYLELLINAVEHGNLEITYAEKSQLLKDGRWLDEIEFRMQQEPYSQRQVEVNMEISHNEVVVTIQDQGNGFEWMNYLDFSPERAFDLHGRGIAMAKLLGFDSLEYLGNGNTVLTRIKQA